MGPERRSSAMEPEEEEQRDGACVFFFFFFFFTCGKCREREGQRSLVALLLSVELQISSRIFQAIHEAVLWN